MVWRSSQTVVGAGMNWAGWVPKSSRIRRGVCGKYEFPQTPLTGTKVMPRPEPGTTADLVAPSLATSDESPRRTDPLASSGPPPPLRAAVRDVYATPGLRHKSNSEVVRTIFGRRPPHPQILLDAPQQREVVHTSSTGSCGELRRRGPGTVG